MKNLFKYSKRYLIAYLLIFLFCILFYFLSLNVFKAFLAEEAFNSFKASRRGNIVSIPTNSFIEKNVVEVISKDFSSIFANRQEVEEELNTEVYDENDLKLLATTIYCEAGPDANLQGCMAVGWVIKNRLESEAFDYTSYSEVIFDREIAVQFTATLRSDFNEIQEIILSMDSEHAKLSVLAAERILEGSTLYKLPEDVLFFYGDMDKREWGNHTYYDSFGGNSFFY